VRTRRASVGQLPLVAPGIIAVEVAEHEVSLALALAATGVAPPLLVASVAGPGGVPSMAPLVVVRVRGAGTAM
jgi:hypothetical protein